jgi:ATP-dependent DNA helicase RecG
MTESNRIEYKKDISDSLEKDAVAFLNSREGGSIIIGVDPKTNDFIGIKNPDCLQLTIKDRLKNNIAPSTLGLFDILLENYDGKIGIKIIFSSAPEKPYHIKKYGMSQRGCFIRIGSASEPMSSQMIEESFSKRTRRSIGLIKSPRQEPSFEQLKIYYNELGLTLGKEFAINLELLNSDKEFNYAGYLLSDNNSNSIKIARYSGVDRIELVENKEFGYCCLVKACKQVLDRLQVENTINSKITAKQRIDTPLLNPIALREAVINAIIHNDYTNEVPPKFELFSDRIEITSAGGPPQGLKQNEFFKGYSVPRNKELIRVFKDLELIEHLASGVPRILKYYSEQAFEFTDNFLRITFPGSSALRVG